MERIEGVEARRPWASSGLVQACSDTDLRIFASAGNYRLISWRRGSYTG